MRRALASVAVVSLLFYAACSADGGGIGDLTNDPDAATEPGVVLPPPSNNTDASTDSGGKDASTKDAGDASMEAGPTAPAPGSPCTKADAIASRMCGKCGKQEAICQTGDAEGGALVWSEYGPCAGEQGICLPGTKQACGNCGNATCTNYCTWSACGGQPANSCSPNSVESTTAGCPNGGFRSRSCQDSCQWTSYSMTCDVPQATNLWAGGPGAYSTFMKSSDGKVYGWGLDADGQLGDSMTTDQPKMKPVPFGGVLGMALGGGTTYGIGCAAFGGNGAKCWGYNSTTYTLGDGVTSTSLTPIVPTGWETNVTSVVAGYAHVCALRTAGTAECFGYNTYGQLGNASTTTSKTPVPVSGLTGVTAIASGYYTVCALKGDEAYCWGYNTYGQIGDGTTTARSTPTLVGTGFANVAPSYYHTCAAMTDGSAQCWGENLNGEIGEGTGGAGAPAIKTPVPVVGIDGIGMLAGVSEVCTGYGTSCARLGDGRVACWGRNADAQLGIGSLSPAMSNVPKVVSGITAATKLTCGYKHACVIDGGKVKCWGDNQYGEIGNGGMPADALTPQVATY